MEVTPTWHYKKPRRTNRRRHREHTCSYGCKMDVPWKTILENLSIYYLLYARRLSQDVATNMSSLKAMEMRGFYNRSQMLVLIITVKFLAIKVIAF